MKDEFWYPSEGWRFQSKTNKQGSDGILTEDDLHAMDEVYQHALDWCKSAYNGLLERGVAKEIARAILPVSLYSEMYATVDLHNLVHFIKLRSDSHAQKEIRDYSDAMKSLIQPVIPWCYEALLGGV